MPWDDEHARRQVARAEELLSGLDSLPDSAAAARAAETVETLVGLYGDCLARIMRLAHAADSGTGADAGADTADTAHTGAGVGSGTGSGAVGGLVRRLADDELVGHLLLVHDLHPDPVDTRVRRVLDELGPQLRSQGADLELLELSETAVRVRLQGGGRGCSSSSEPLEQAVRDALAARAPEIGTVEIETAQAPAPETLIPVDALFQGRTLTGRGAG